MKENGFLGLVSMHKRTGKLFIASKSTNQGPFAKIVEELFQRYNSFALENYLREHNVTLVFEVIDQIRDPHIIEYPFDTGLILLDVVENTWEGAKLPYHELKKLGESFGIPVKQKAFLIADGSELQGLFLRVNDYDFKFLDRRVEGFVVEDSNGFMAKMKCAYYFDWKQLRTLVGRVIKGSQLDTRKIQGELQNYFYGWCKDLRNGSMSGKLPESIIGCREQFFNCYPEMRERYA